MSRAPSASAAARLNHRTSSRASIRTPRCIGLRWVANAIERRGWNAEAALGRGAPFNYAVRWLPNEEHRPRVKVVIPTRDRLELLKRAVKGVLARTDHVDVELVIVDNGSEEPETLVLPRWSCGSHRVTIVRVDDAFNLSRMCNIGSRAGSPSDFSPVPR